MSELEEDLRFQLTGSIRLSPPPLKKKSEGYSLNIVGLCEYWKQEFYSMLDQIGILAEISFDSNVDLYSKVDGYI